jgi:predicted CXXCH cytochrome family protein
MKKSVLVVALAVVLVFAFATSAFATSGKFWNYQADYYSWGSQAGDNNGALLSSVGANPTNPGVHGNYLANTAKCGICHSVHRANASGVKLLNTATATCAGCHKAGTSTVTNVTVSWQTGGPHSSGTDASCNARGCHLNNPHGANGSQYKIFAAKLINNVSGVASGAKADESAARALVDSAASGVTLDDLNGTALSTWDTLTRRAIVVGYTCNSNGCHMQSMLPVIKKNYAEDRELTYPGSENASLTAPFDGPKTGHLVALNSVTGSGEATATHSSYTSVTSCTSCHDQKDSATRTGFTFPHSETPFGTSNMGAGRAYLWMGYAGEKGAALTAMGSGDKAFDGACLKCHRDNGAVNGIGITF